MGAQRDDDGTELGGVSHVALTVRDLQRSVRWYGDVLGLRVLAPYDTDDFERRILAHPSGVAIALTQHRSATEGSFDPRRVGLDHLSLRVRDRVALDAWAERLDAAGVEHGGVQLGGLPGAALLAFRDPDGIQLELYALAEPR